MCHDSRTCAIIHLYVTLGITETHQLLLFSFPPPPAFLRLHTHFPQVIVDTNLAGKTHSALSLSTFPTPMHPNPPLSKPRGGWVAPTKNTTSTNSTSHAVGGGGGGVSLPDYILLNTTSNVTQKKELVAEGLGR